MKEALDLVVNMMDLVSSSISGMLPKVRDSMLSVGNYQNTNA